MGFQSSKHLFWLCSLVIFAEAGARAVYALDIRSPDNFASLAAEIKKVAPNCHFEPVIADAASEADVKGICDKALKDHGRLDVFFAKWVALISVDDLDPTLTPH